MGVLDQVYLGSLSISKMSPLMVALVPTGIKTGVVSLMPLSVICQTLAFHFFLSILNWSLDFIVSVLYSVVFNFQAILMLEAIKTKLFEKYDKNDSKGLFFSLFDKDGNLLVSNGVLQTDKNMNDLVEIISAGILDKEK